MVPAPTSRVCLSGSLVVHISARASYPLCCKEYSRYRALQSAATIWPLQLYGEIHMPASPEVAGRVLEVKTMCVVAAGRSVPDIWFTFTVSTCQVSGFTVSVGTHVPVVLERLMRSISDLDGSLETTYEQGPIWLARSCRAGGSRGRYTRVRTSPFIAR